MPDKIYSDISGAIAILAQKLGVAAEHVYTVLIRQQFAEGIYAIIIIAVAVLGLLLAVIIFKLCFKHGDKGEEGIAIFLGCTAACIGATALFVILSSTGNVLKVVNPEYYAIQEIIKMVK
jgi:drug/metabolite transporter (DMT)-like permease